MKYQEWLNGCGCCPDIQDCPPSTGNPCDCDSILLELSKQHTDDLVLQDEIDNLDEKKLDASAYTPDEYATEAWVNEQGFLKTVEPLKTINGESLIGEGNIVISGGSGDAYTKAETDALLDEKVNVVDNEVPQFIAQGDKLTRYYPASGTPETVFANMPVKMKVGTSGWEPQRIDDIIYINDENGFVASGNCNSRDQGVLTPRIPSELQPYLTVRAFYEGMNNLFEAKEGYRISYVDATMTDGSGQFEPYITPYFVAYEGGQSADVIKDFIEPTLINKQDTLIAGDYITIDSANTISTSGLVTVEDNEVEEYPVLTSDIYNPSDANFNVTSYDDAADVFELIITGPTFEYFDVSNSRFVFINESGETTADISGIYGFSTSGAVYPTRIQEYVNLDLYEYHTTDRYNVHLKYSCKNGWRLKRFYLYIASGYEEGVEFKTYQNYTALQSADAISENVYPALEKLTANKFDKDFTCNDPLLYEAAYKRFRIKTSNQNNDTISASTSATTNLARAYDVKTYVSGFTYDKDTIDNKIAGGGTFDPTLYYKKSETSGKTEIQNALDLKLDASAFTESDYYKKSETSGKTELDAEFDKYYEKDETSGKTELSNEFELYYKKSETSSKTEIDDALLLDAYEDYKTKNTYTSAFPSLTETADWNNAIQGGIYARHSDFWQDDSYEMLFKLQVIDENGNTFSAATSNITEKNFTVDNVNPLSDYIDVVRPTYVESPYYGRVLESWIFKPKDGYRISYAQIDNYWEDEFRRHNNITEIEWYDAFPSGYTKDIIENYIEPKLANAQEKLSFDDNVRLRTSEGKLVPYVPTDYSISDWYSGSTNPVQTKAVYNYTYSKAQIDEKIASGGSITSGDVQTMIDSSISGKTNNSDFSAHTANTAIHLTSGDIQTQIDNSISGKADSADVYTKAETYTKTEVDNKFWCGTEAQWAQISGSTENGILYLIY